MARPPWALNMWAGEPAVDQWAEPWVGAWPLAGESAPWQATRHTGGRKRRLAGRPGHSAGRQGWRQARWGQRHDGAAGERYVAAVARIAAGHWQARRRRNRRR